MDWRRILLGSLTAAAMAGSADAGIIFNRSKPKDQPPPKEQPKPTAPEEHVGDLAKALRSSPDEHRRIAAAAELGKSDLRQTPQAGEALIAALQQDPSPAVRAEAAQAIAKLRPLTLQAGQALEDAMNTDNTPRVRTAARTAIGIYVSAGYRTGTPSEKPAIPTQPASRPTQVAKKPPVQPQRPPVRQSGEPPLANAKPNDEADQPRPVLIPPRQGKPPVIELKPEPITPKPEAPKPAKPSEDGPILIGPG